ncbi:hypothetical protein ACRAWG_39440 (plasmid) [Methylobacterium sp. P31]
MLSKPAYPITLGNWMPSLLPPQGRGFMEAACGLLFIIGLLVIGWHLPLHG